MSKDLVYQHEYWNLLINIFTNYNKCYIATFENTQAHTNTYYKAVKYNLHE